MQSTAPQLLLKVWTWGNRTANGSALVAIANARQQLLTDRQWQDRQWDRQWANALVRAGYQHPHIVLFPTLYLLLATCYSLLATLYLLLATLYYLLPTLYSVLSTQYSVLNTEY